jgi:uncharacterized alkaline shock family protein YloU
MIGGGARSAGGAESSSSPAQRFESRRRRPLTDSMRSRVPSIGRTKESGMSTASTGKSEPTEEARASSPVDSGGSGLQSGQGATAIADTVVSKIAGRAARAVPGVHGLGGGPARAVGALRERIPGASTNSLPGVAVEVGERQAAVDLTIVVEYGTAIGDLTKAVRRSVIGSLEQMTGLDVVEVNIAVDDLHLPSDDAGDSGDSGGGKRVARRSRKVTGTWRVA